MKQQEVFNKIGGIIKELNEQYQYLEAPGKLNDLELEFFIANTHFLTHNIELLRKLYLQNLEAKPEEQSIPVNKEKYFEPFVQAPQPEPENTPVPAAETQQPAEEKIVNLSDTVTDAPTPQITLTTQPDQNNDYAYIRQEPEIIRHELEVDESLNDEDDPLNEQQKTEEPLAVNHPVDKLPDTPAKSAGEPQTVTPGKEEVLTINQKMSARLTVNKQVDELKVLPVSDLKSATTLNDKLLYIKDLFNGYSLAYSEAIEILNRFNTLEDADRFLKTNYATKNRWDEKPETTAKFYELLNRRYA